MIVILKRDVKGTGKAGEVVKVSDGYARNMLIPKGYAIEATKGNINTLEKVKAKQAEEEAAAKAAAEELAEKIEKIDVTILTKAGTGGRLFGSITTKEISENLLKQHGIEIDSKKIVQPEPIKTFGSFEVKCKFGHEINGTIHLLVVEEK